MNELWMDLDQANGSAWMIQDLGELDEYLTMDQ